MSSRPEHNGQPERMDDAAAWLRAAARGDEGAWAQLVARYGARVYALVRARCRRDDLAEEVTQSVFVTLAEQVGSGEYSEQGRFESWLFRIAMNRLRDEIRREARQARPTDPAHFGAAQAPERPKADEEEFASLRAALACLADADREVVELRHHADLSFKAIAGVLEEPLGTVLARHHRALRKIKQLMTEGAATAGAFKGSSK